MPVHIQEPKTRRFGQDACAATAASKVKPAHADAAVVNTIFRSSATAGNAVDDVALQRFICSFGLRRFLYSAISSR